MRHSRRQFIASSSLLLASSVVGAEKPAALVGSQLYGWGQFYEREGKVLDEHLDDVFSALRDSGFDYAEGTLDLARPENNGRFAECLKAKGLKPVAYYTGGRLHEPAASEKTIVAIVNAAQICAQSGFQVINCNPDPIGRAKTDHELQTQAGSLNLLGSELRELGLKLAVHNHTPEMINNGREFRYNLTQTEPRNVHFCYDVHWVYRGGVTPETALKEFGTRVASWHLRQSNQGVWTEDLGEGDVDYEWIARTIQQRHLPEILSVEIALENGTKVTRSAVANHRRSREFVRRVFGV